MEHFSCAADLLARRMPDVPVLCVRPHAAARAVAWFREHFPGTTLYAVKANDAPDMLAALHGAGLRDFDAASLDEIARVRPARRARPCHEPDQVARADPLGLFRDYGVRTFAFDSADELDKIIAETGGARDLTLMLRIYLPEHAQRNPAGGQIRRGAGDAATC